MQPLLNKKILFIYKEDYPWDVRVEKIALSLVHSGANVTIVSANREQREKADKQGEIKIFRLPKAWKTFHTLTKKIINIPLSFNPFWILLVFRSAQRQGTEVIIVRDLPLMPLAIIIAKFLRAKVVYDMAECYPEMYRSSLDSDKTNIFERIAKSPTLSSIKEYICCQLSDRILVMVKESRDRLLNKGVSSDKILIVSNTPISSNKPPIVHKGNKLNLVYLGFVTRIRGLDLLIDAISHCSNNDKISVDIQLDIIGKGSAQQALTEQIDRLNLKNKVKVHGWLDHHEVEKILESCNVGIITYRFCPHWNTTVPNKLFDYMQKGLPVLSSHIIPVSRIIKETNCGVSAESDSALEFSRLLLLLRDEKLRAKLGRNGRDATENLYNWSFDYIRLEDYLKAL